MNITLFHPEQATQLARELTPALERLVAMRGEIRAIGTRLEVLSLALAGASEANPDVDEARRLGERRRELDLAIRAGVEAIHVRGVQVKDLDLGLLDFYALAGDRLVFLCWRLGEPEVAHWHPLAGGYGTRQPLHGSRLDEEGRA